MSSDKTDKQRSHVNPTKKRTLSLKSTGINLGATSGSMARGRGKAVEVEIKRSRTSARAASSVINPIVKTGKPSNLLSRLDGTIAKPASAAQKSSVAEAAPLTADEKALAQRRIKAEQATKALEEVKQQQRKDQATVEELENARRQREERQERENKQRQHEAALAAAQQKAEESKKLSTKTEVKSDLVGKSKRNQDGQHDDMVKPEKKAKPPRGEDDRRRQGKLTIAQALSADGETYNRSRSVAALKRQRDKEKARAMAQRDRQEMVVREVIVPETIRISDLAGRMAVRGADVIKHLFKNGMVLKINDYLDADTAELVVEEFGHKVVRVAESDVEDNLLIPEDSDAERLSRSAVVTVMGHVDHGKTSLLDTLRQSRVAAGEAGGITQHIAAYRVATDGKNWITFLDTPGHEAFSSMRSRGAKATDIVVLVVAANDGIMPQTIEAINHAKAAKVPIIVAINKCDLAEADPQKVRLELLSHEIVGEDNGGDTLIVEISALTGQGIDNLLEAIQLQAELLELSAVHSGRARGVVIEARQEIGRGVVATVLVQSGCLQKGDIFVAGHEWGRIKMQYDDQGKVLAQAGPSCPVEIQGLQGVVSAGDELIVVVEESQAREITEYRQRKMKEARLASVNRNSIDQMFQSINNKDISELNIILRCDVLGSSEAIVQSLEKISTEEISVKVIHHGIGAITESDIALAQSSNALVIGFNVRANNQARELAKRDGISLRYFAIIYELIDDVKALASGLLSPEEREEFLGYAEVLQVFNLTKIGTVAGCTVTEGLVRRGAEVRLLRENVVIHRGQLSQLKRHKDDVNEVRSGTECGISFANYNDLKVGDRIECFTVIQEKRQL